MSEKKEIRDTIMQGETVSSIQCTTSIDKISRDCPIEVYKYREVVAIPKMSFVDDIVDVNKCGKETLKMNEYTAKEISKRRLQLSYDKCVRMHVKRKRKSKEDNSNCEKLVIDGWAEKKTTKNNGTKYKLEDAYLGKMEIKTVESHTYLGDTQCCPHNFEDWIYLMAA